MGGGQLGWWLGVVMLGWNGNVGDVGAGAGWLAGFQILPRVSVAHER